MPLSVRLVRSSAENDETPRLLARPGRLCWRELVGAQRSTISRSVLEIM